MFKNRPEGKREMGRLKLRWGIVWTITLGF
jgi:hypothetical protein